MVAHLVEWIYQIFYGRTPDCNWYMSTETRNVVIDAARRLGEEFIRVKATRYHRLPEGSTTRSACDNAIAELCREIISVAKNDPSRTDFFFRPAIFTRLDAYMKVDGIHKKDRRLIIKKLSAHLNGVTQII